MSGEGPLPYVNTLNCVSSLAVGFCVTGAEALKHE